MEYDAWFAIINPHNQSDTEPLTLYDHLNRQSWFLRIESVTKTKCLLVTTKSNLPEARAWIDSNLERLVRKSIPPEVPSSFLLRRLDKPVYTKTSQTYAEILKKQFSLTTTPTTNENDNNRPPRKRQAKILDYASDQATDSPIIATNFTSSSTNSSSPPGAPKVATVDYADELTSLKKELQSLRTLINTVVTQLKTDIKEAIDSIHAPCHPQTSNAMDTDTDCDTYSQHHTSTQHSALNDIIHDFKHEIATIVTETHALFHQQATLMTKATPQQQSVT